MTFVDEVKNAVTPRAALLVLGVLALQLLFIASYVGALHRPEPTDVPFAVVAPPQISEQLVTRLDALPGGPLDPRPADDAAEAREQIMNRDIDGALIVDPTGTTDTVLVASGGGTVLADSLTRIMEKVDATQRRTVRTVDVAPASPDDFDGLSSFYLVVGWCVGGYLCASILAISAGTKPANPQRALIRTATMALYAIAGGIGGAVIIGPVLGALPGSVWGLWGLGALVVFAVGMTTLALEALTGIIGIGLAVLIIVIAGNPSAGGAFPLPMLPDFWRAIGPALPPGAGTWSARSIAYFKGNALTGPLLVLSAWAVAGTALTLLLSMRRKPADTHDGTPTADSATGTAPGGPTAAWGHRTTGSTYVERGSGEACCEAARRRGRFTMADTTAAEWWELLPAGIRRQADGYVLQDARFQAIRLVWEAGRAQGLGLNDAQVVVHERYVHFGEAIARTPDSPLDLESLAARAAGAPGRVVAIEAVWDGDTVHDWFVDLVAVTSEPAGEQRLATICRDAAVRYLGDEDRGARHPAAVAADRAGKALSARLSVPFHFASPHTPDDSAPRRRP